MPVKACPLAVCSFLLCLVALMAGGFAYTYRFSAVLPASCTASNQVRVQVVDGQTAPVADVAACVVPSQSGSGELAILITNTTPRILVFDDIRCAGNSRRTGILEPQYLAGLRDGGCELVAVGPYERVVVTAQIAIHSAFVPEVLLRERLKHQSILVTEIK